MGVNLNTGILFKPFANAIKKYGSVVTRYPVTKTLTNVTGDEIPTYGAAEYIQAYITIRSDERRFDKAGLIYESDAIMLVQPLQDLYPDDKIVFNGDTFKVQKVIDRSQAGGNVAFKRAELFRIS